jgi:hypothetical protein
MKLSAKRAILGGGGLVLLGLAIWVGPVLRDLYTRGFFEKQEKRTYTGDSEANLKAIQTALLLYHESEGQFPSSLGWMDAIENRLATGDMEGKESRKKLVRPDLLDQEGRYGYAMNREFSQKYKEDVRDIKAPLVFESADTSRNASATTREFVKGVGITVQGTIVRAGKM